MNGNKSYCLIFFLASSLIWPVEAECFSPSPLMSKIAGWAKSAMMNGGKEVGKIVVAQGILTGIEMLYAKGIAAAYGNATRARGLQNRNPQLCPAGKGLIAPETVPADVDQVIQLINHPERLNRVGANLWRGILLAGGPGTGKTELGYYIAKHTGQPVVYEGAMGLIDAAQGSGARSLRELFLRAGSVGLKDRLKMVYQKIRSLFCTNPQSRKLGVVILDEIDAIGQTRQAAVAGLDRAREAERARALEQLLAELDGAHQPGTLPDVFVVATSNLPVAALDEALVRPGRLQVINVPQLTQEQRVAILNFHAHRVPTPLGPDVDFNALVQAGNNLTGADLAHILNDAKIRVANNPNPIISQQDLLDALHHQHANRQQQHQHVEPVREPAVAAH